ncbi:MAG: hypothetical protein HONBIEJF_00794 [Fimbriimonadaceae bacterium]|nr:hypothetical protein [Fimbriimonadaceae bacterium]
MGKLSTITLFAACAIGAVASDAIGPKISAKSAVLMDADSGKVLWGRNIHQPRFPASTTKILTAILLIERCRMDEAITAPEDIETIGEASIHLKPKEQVSAGDMLKAIMLRSANDACCAVANHISGSVEEFAKLMNDRAKELGCLNTHFTNPNGLNDPNHQTTAFDLAMMARHAMTDPTFREVAKLRKTKIARSINQADRWLISKNKLLKTDKTVEGVKTGYTNPAGRCFVGSATRNGFRLLTVVLKSEDWIVDTNALLDYGFKTFTLKPSEGLAKPIEIKGGTIGKLDLTAATPATVVKPNETLQWVARIPNHVSAPVVKGQVLGHWEAVDGDGFVRRVDAIAPVDVPLAPFASRLVGGNPGVILIALVLGTGAYALRRRARSLV